MNPKKRTFARTYRLCSLDTAVSHFLEKHGGGKAQRHMNALWENWDAVMGHEIASLGQPMGHKESELLVGADDSMALQELTLQAPEILERANVFMDTSFFSRVRVSLFQSKDPLSIRRLLPGMDWKKPEIPPPPPGFGGLQGHFDPNSPIGRCYEEYLRMYSQQ